MLCGVEAGSRRRRLRDTGETPRDLPDSNPHQRALNSTRHSSCFYLPYLQRVQLMASSNPVIYRPRRFRFFSLRYFSSLFSSPSMSVVSGNRKLAAEVPNVREIEGTRGEKQTAGTVNCGSRRGSAKKKYSVSPADYRLLEEVGQGASATVYRALYIPCNEIIAVKYLDLDRCNSNLDSIRKEAQTMSLAYHPNVIKSYCSFVVEHYLWFVMPFMAEGSCFHLMKFAYPDGFEEHVIGSVLKETLKALVYLHKHGHIHRDVKAGNILLDSSGGVQLSDFGVTACMFDKGDRQHSRNTFVGTPCWMAPEVMQPGGGYDFKADIWSFGITALELAHGHAPFSKYPPMKVLLMTLQNAPPGLDYDRDKKFSKSFKEMVSICLVKDQTRRPTAEKLLKHPFFKNSKPPEFSVKSLFADLPPLWERVKMLHLKDAEQLASKKMPSAEQEALSQSEYQRGVSAWNFDIEDLKVQASLIRDVEDIAETEEIGGILKDFNNKVQNSDDIIETEKDSGSLRSFTINEDTYNSRYTLEKLLSAYENSDRDESENKVPRPDGRKSPNLNGPLIFPNHASPNSLTAPTQLPRGFDEYSKDMPRENVVQIKGRFSVKSVDVDIVKPVDMFPKGNGNISLPASILVPHLQNIFQQTSFQQDLLMNLLEGMHKIDLVSEIPSHTLFKAENGVLVKGAITERELLLLVKISELQTRISELTDELTATRLQYTQLQHELNAAYLKRDEEKI